MGQMWEGLLPKIVGKEGDYCEVTRCRARLEGFDFEDEDGKRHGRVNLHFSNISNDPKFPARWTTSLQRGHIGFTMMQDRPALYFVTLGHFTYDDEKES